MQAGQCSDRLLPKVVLAGLPDASGEKSKMLCTAIRAVLLWVLLCR